jgi:hypothetical protein
MKKGKPMLVVGIVFIATATSLLISSPVDIRTVDFIKILVLGAGLGVLITQAVANKA